MVAWVNVLTILPLLLGRCHGLDSAHILPQLIPGPSQLSANRQKHKALKLQKHKRRGFIYSAKIQIFLCSFHDFEGEIPGLLAILFLISCVNCPGFDLIMYGGIPQNNCSLNGTYSIKEQHLRRDEAPR